MNSELKDRKFKLPEEIVKKISQHISELNGTHVYGIDRAQKLVNDKMVSYGQLKSIIHDIKNIDKETELTKYNLFGGELMERWANTYLNNERQYVKNLKQMSKVANDVGSIEGRKNPYIKKHTKKETNKIPVNPLKSNSDKSSISSLTDLKLFEQITKIKKLM